MNREGQFNCTRHKNLFATGRGTMTAVKTISPRISISGRDPALPFCCSACSAIASLQPPALKAPCWPGIRAPALQLAIASIVAHTVAYTPRHLTSETLLPPKFQTWSVAPPITSPLQHTIRPAWKAVRLTRFLL
jgi:hypothetical protein